jgi:surface protein
MNKNMIIGLGILIMVVGLVTSLTSDDFFTRLDSNSISKMTAEITFNNVLTTPILKEDFRVDANSQRDWYNSIKTEILSTCYGDKVVYDDKLTNVNYIDKDTGKEVTYDYYAFLRYDKVPYDCWKEINVSLPVGTSKIKYILDAKPSSCKNGWCVSTDWIPSISQPDYYGNVSSEGDDAELKLTQDKWAWWNVSYAKCKNITISNPTGTAQTNFPVNLNLTYDADMQADFDDLRFFSGGCSAAGNALYAELESKTDSANAYVWVKANLTAGNNTISMYYANSSVMSNWDNGANVWDTNYVLVMHLNDTHDSSSYQNNGTVSGATQTNGRWGKAYNFDGVANAINISTSSSLNISTNISMSAIYYVDTYPNNNPRIISRELTTTAQPYALEADITNKTMICVYTGGEACLASNVSSTRSLSWNYFEGTWNNLTIKTYVNGTVHLTTANVGPMTGYNYNVMIGNNPSLNRAFDGIIDEVRISKTERSASWINLTYQLIVNQASFISYAAEESDYVFTGTSPYYFSNSGNDSSTTCNVTSPCQTVAKFNTLPQIPGDIYYWNGGDTWRMPSDDYPDFDTDGNSTGNITFTSYGTGKAIFLSSRNVSNSTCWINSSSKWTYNSSCDTFPNEVGNIIFVDFDSAGWRVDNLTGVDSQGDWFWNSTAQTITLYSTTDPVTYYGHIEAAQEQVGAADGSSFSIENRDYLVIKNITVKYSGGGGIHGYTNTNIYILDNDVEWSGGIYYTHYTGARYADGIGFGMGLDNLQILRNNVSHCADSCITWQSWATAYIKTQTNVFVDYNIIGYTPYGMVIFSTNTSSNVVDPRIDHNTFHHIGQNNYANWTDVVGRREIRIGLMPYNTTGFNITNNIFSTYVTYGIDLGDATSTEWKGSKPYIDYNTYDGGTTNIVMYNGTNYKNTTTFCSGVTQECNGVTADPLINSITFHPVYSSPVCGAASDGSDIGAVPCETCTVCNETCSPCGGGCTATDLTLMFAGVVNFNTTIGDITGWDTSCVTDMSGLFEGATDFNQDIGGWNLSHVTSINSMFEGATIFNQDLSGWNVSNVTDMGAGVFQDTSFNQDISSWDTSQVTDMSEMFGESPFNQDISGWDTSNVMIMIYMFYNSSFDQDIGDWNVSNVLFMNGMFNGTTLSTNNYDSLLNAWGSRLEQNAVTLDAGNSKYSSAGLNGRNNLTSTYAWIITDGGSTIPPTINIISPINGTVTNDNTPTFSFNYTDDDSATANCSLHTGNSYCYQESTNITNQSGTDGNCGLNYSGNTSTFFPARWTNSTLLYDGNWSSSANKTNPTTTADLDINYRMPINAMGAIWQVGMNETINFTLPQQCINRTDRIIQLKLFDISGTVGVYLRCYKESGSYYSFIPEVYGDPVYYEPVYEEGIYWIINDSIQSQNTSVLNNTLTNLTSIGSLADGNLNAYITCTDLSGNVGTSNLINFTITTNPYVSIISPINGSNVSSNNMNITYQLLGNATENPVSYYNISLLNSNGSFNATIQGNNSVNVSYLWTNVLSGYLGTYIVRVDAINSSGSIFATGNGTYTVVTNAVLNITALANGTVLSNFTVTLTPGNSTFTSTGSVLVSIIKNLTYTVDLVGEGAGVGSVTMNWSNDTNYLVFNVSYNNLQIFFFNELNNSPIYDNVSVTLSSITNSFTGSNVTGNLTLMWIPPDLYQILLTATGYSNKEYNINIYMNNTLQVLNTTLIPNASSTLFMITIQDLISRVIPGARIIISRAYGGVWTVIADSYTDDGGVVYIPLESGTPYVVTIIANGYLTKTFTYTFLAANNPYTFKLSSTSGTVYTDVFNDLNYTYSPTNTLLVNGSNTFTLNVLSLSSSLTWASINSSLNNSNLSGNPIILIPSITVNLANLSGNTYPVTYCIKQIHYSAYCFTVNYYVEGRGNVTNSLINSLGNFRGEFVGGTSTGWLTLIAVVIILVICVLVSSLSGSSSVTTIAGFVGMIIFAYLGWLNLILCGFVCVIGLLLFFFNRTGGQQ